MENMTSLLTIKANNNNLEAIPFELLSATPLQSFQFENNPVYNNGNFRKIKGYEHVCVCVCVCVCDRERVSEQVSE